MNTTNVRMWEMSMTISKTILRFYEISNVYRKLLTSFSRNRCTCSSVLIYLRWSEVLSFAIRDCILIFFPRRVHLHGCNIFLLYFLHQSKECTSTSVCRTWYNWSTTINNIIHFSGNSHLYSEPINLTLRKNMPLPWLLYITLVKDNCSTVVVQYSAFLIFYDKIIHFIITVHSNE